MTTRREILLSKMTEYLTQDEIDDVSREGRQIVIALLKPVLHNMIKLGRQRHWAYDITLHQNLVELIHSEIDAIAALDREAA